MRPGDRSPRRAFTTVEMLAVLVLAGLLAALATLSLAAPLRAADRQRVADRIAFADPLARNAARTAHCSGKIGFESEASRVLDSGTRPPRELYRLPAGWRLDRLLKSRGGESSDAMAVAVSAAGLSCSYAVRISSGEASEWIVINGITGRAEEFEDEQKAIEMLAPSGDDAR